MAIKECEAALFNPTFVLKFVVAPFRVDACIGRLDLFGNPFLKCFILTFLHNDVFQHLKIVRQIGAVAFDSVFKFHDGADFLTGLAVHHAEGLRHIAHLHCVDHFCHVLRQVLHLEASSERTARFVLCYHQTCVVARVLVVRELLRSFFKAELPGFDIGGDGIQA